MNRVYFNLTLLFFNVCSFNLYAAASAAKYENNLPIFYAALAEASYKKSTVEADVRLREIVGPTAKVLSRKVYRSVLFGNTNFILARDRNNDLHVAIEGSNDIGNWIGNAAMVIRGTLADYDVPNDTREAMHRMILHWEKKHKKPIVSISGHSQGGMYASQMVHDKYDEHYRRTGAQVITFNCLKPKEGDNQLHFLVTKEHAASLLSPSGRYIKIDKSGKHTNIWSNHGFKYFFRAFKGKSWQDVR